MSKSYSSNIFMFGLVCKIFVCKRILTLGYRETLKRHVEALGKMHFLPNILSKDGMAKLNF